MLMSMKQALSLTIVASGWPLGLFTLTSSGLHKGAQHLNSLITTYRYDMRCPEPGFK